MVDVSFRTLQAPPEVLHIRHLNSADLDEARAVLSGFFSPVVLGTPDGPASFAATIRVIQLGPLTVGQVSFAAPVVLHGAELDAYYVCMPVSGRVHARHAGLDVVATPTTGAIFRPGSPVYIRHEANSTVLAVKIDRAALEDELAALLSHPVEGPLDLAPTMHLTEGPAQSWNRLVRLLGDELEYAESLLFNPMLVEQVRSCVISGLLLSVPHRHHSELTTAPSDGPPRPIRRAMEAIHDEPERAFSVTDLAGVAGMSVRSLQEGFRRHIGLAPMAYLQTVRLDRARESLRTADPCRVTVAAIAHRWGFAHLGRFASAYRSRFGESPSETLRAAG